MSQFNLSVVSPCSCRWLSFFYHFYTLSSKLKCGENLRLSRQDRLIVWEGLNSSACLKSIDIVIHTSSFHQTCENKIRLVTLNFRENLQPRGRVWSPSSCSCIVQHLNVLHLRVRVYFVAFELRHFLVASCSI